MSEHRFTDQLTTTLALDAVAYERAPRYREAGKVNLRIVCEDGFTVSVQASSSHYAQDSSGTAPYWDISDQPKVSYPFATFEIGYPSEAPEPDGVWAEFDSGGVWAWVPRAVVADLADLHGGAIAWETPTIRPSTEETK